MIKLNLFGALKKQKMNKKNIMTILMVIILPIILGSIFIMQRYFSKANSDNGCLASNIKTIRDTGVSGMVRFSTQCSMIAKIFCSTEKEGQYSLCGTELTATTQHEIKTDPSKSLQSDTGYYIRLSTGQYFESLIYLFPFSEFGDKGACLIKSNEYNGDLVGECQGDVKFDPKFDINQDGCVNMSDVASLYP
jgi:hypothetical protein